MQLYLILAAAFVVWSGTITGAAYLKGSTNGAAKEELICVQKIADKDTAIDKQKMAAAQIMAVESKNVQDTEQKLRDAKDNQEITDAKNKQDVAVLTGRVHALAGIVGRLRDPNQSTAGCGDGSSGPQGETPTAASNRQYDRAEAGGLVSPQLTGFLYAQAESCDEINLAYISCREDALSLRSVSGPGVR